MSNSKKQSIGIAISILLITAIMIGKFFVGNATFSFLKDLFS